MGSGNFTVGAKSIKTSFYSPLYRHRYLQPGPPAQRQSSTSPQPPAAASLPQHPPRAFPSWGHTLHGLTRVQLLCVLQGSGSRHKLRSQSLVQSGHRDGPRLGVFGFGSGARRHLSGLFRTLLWGVDAQQRQQQAECGVMCTLAQGHMQHTGGCEECWVLFYGDWIIRDSFSLNYFKAYRKKSYLMLTG